MLTCDFIWFMLLDVINFLYILVDEVIFMQQLQGFVMKGKKNMICKLLKSLYGLK